MRNPSNKILRIQHPIFTNICHLKIDKKHSLEIHKENKKIDKWAISEYKGHKYMILLFLERC